MSATQGQDPEREYGQDTLKVYRHEGDGENTEHLNSMDLHDVKTELERDAEKAETAASATTSTDYSAGQTSSASTSATVQQANIRPILQPHMVYPNGSAVSFMVPPFAGTPIYPVTAGFRPVKVEGADWSKVSQGQISIPAYSYPAGFLPVDQSGLRPAYPFMIPGQYVATQMPYHQQLTALGTPVAPNAAVHPNSGLITPTIKEKKPHIKKPLNAFMLFMKQKRADVIKECTLKESAAINQILGKMWHALDRSEQAKYYEMAREERAKHMQMYPGWSARDNYAVHKKRRKKKVKQVNEACEDDNDPNSRKCRARYGLDQQNMWCGPCRRKKKCIRSSEGDDDLAPQMDLPEGDDDAIEGSTISTGGDATSISNSGENPRTSNITTQSATAQGGGASIMISDPQTTDQSGTGYHGSNATPTLTQQPPVPISLHTAAAT